MVKIVSAVGSAHNSGTYLSKLARIELTSKLLIVIERTSREDIAWKARDSRQFLHMEFTY